MNYDSGKEVFPAGGAGRYEAMIMFKNRGDSGLENVVIHDVIPGAFELLEWKVTSSGGNIVKCDMVEDATTDGKKMSWNIGTVSRDERIEVTYEFKGDPEIGFKVSDAQEIHGIDVGAEIEDDESPAELPSEQPTEEVEEEAAEEEVEEEAAEEEVEEEAADEESGDEDDEMDAALAKLTGSSGSAESDSSEARSCTICNAEVAAGLTQCPVCSFTF